MLQNTLDYQAFADVLVTIINGRKEVFVTTMMPQTCQQCLSLTIIIM